jgi:hypothetical protein
VNDTATTQKSEKPPKKKRLSPLQYAGTFLNSEEYMQNLRGTIELASIPAPKINYPNPRSLAAALATYPDLVDAYVPDWSGDQQLSFGESLLNRSTHVFDLVHSSAVNIGLIEF